METSLGINFSYKRFTSSKDKDFLKALMIYNDTIPVDTKTSTSEIIYFADHATDQPKRETVLCAAFAPAAGSMLFVHPDMEYLGYIDY